MLPSLFLVATWIKRNPETHAWCWWKLESNLKHIYRPDPARPIEIIEYTHRDTVTLWLCHRDQANKRMLTDKKWGKQESTFLLDQRAWLAKQGFPQEGK